MNEMTILGISAILTYALYFYNLKKGNSSNTGFILTIVLVIVMLSSIFIIKSISGTGNYKLATTKMIIFIEIFMYSFLFIQVLELLIARKKR